MNQIKQTYHHPTKRKSVFDAHQIMTLLLISLLFVEILVLRYNPAVLPATATAIANAGLVFFFIWRAMRRRH